MSRLNYNRPISGFALSLARIVFVVALVFLTYNSLRPAQAMGGIENIDKLMHALAYFILAVLLGLAFPRLKLIWVFLLPCFYGALMEILQGCMSAGRSGSVLDMIANVSGALLAVIIWSISVKIFFKR